MLLTLVRIEKGLVPIDDDSVEAIRKVALGSQIFCEYKPHRNMKFHKKYFALLNAVILNQNKFKTVDNLHEIVKYRSGYYDTFLGSNDEKFIKTKSISFHTMDNLEFEKFYSVAIDVCAELVGDEAIEQIIQFN